MSYNTSLKRRFAGILSMIIVLAMIAVIAACSNGNSESNISSTDAEESASSGTSTEVKKEESKEPPTEISIMTIYYSKEPMAPDNPIIQEIEKRTNTKLDITWVSPNNYNDKLNVTLASGDIPDLTFVFDTSSPNIMSLQDQGAFWEIGPYLQDYKNLMSYPEVTWKNVKAPNGKTYGIPRPRPTVANQVLILREDWLDHLNLSMPETIDDLYKVMQAFTHNDPDGNGQNDTIGYPGSVDQYSLGKYSFIEDIFNMSLGDWKLKDGKIVNAYLEPSETQALEFLRNAYTEGLIPSDFAVLKGSQSIDMVRSGQGGIYVDGMNQVWTMGEELRKINPDVNFSAVGVIEGPQGAYARVDAGLFGAYVIPKQVSEEKMKKLLAFMDYGASPEGDTLGNYGLEGTHFTVEDGVKTATPQAETDNISSNSFGQIFKAYDPYFRAYVPGIPMDKFEENKAVIEELSAIEGIGSPVTGLASETFIKVGQDYRKKINDFKIKVIMGTESLESWEEFAKGIKNEPDMKKIEEEFTEAYLKKNG